ncbi:MAG: type I restriction enzyme HsdR N-terminal domain-containing protein [Flavobacteriales bacterium]|nr:type I restriction enzyme HsdR N-terminal domain-containing protein [Flavobacteriales bacterium]MBT6174868.1 type I restriction enzyme HsdR N-terminal domain-containing protein [Flavobacteriales bacterium]
MSRLSDLPLLNFAKPTLVARKGDKHDEILCLVRKKWVALEPEEWVRQHLIYHLSEKLGYPMGLMAVEHTLILNDVAKRADLVCFNKDRMPVLLAECKAPKITLSQKTLDQAARYNLVLKVPTLLLTNGLKHYAVATDPTKPIAVLGSIPEF